MKILITTGLAAADTGGPAKYGAELKCSFEKMGHVTRVIAYSRERGMPIGIRHLFFSARIISSVIWAERIIALDTYSVGVPTVLLARIFRKKVIVRIGGDFLWESYVERTGQKVSLKEFNSKFPKLSTKEKLILVFTRMLTRKADILAFNTQWQRNIWEVSYSIPNSKTRVIKNYMPGKNPSPESNGKFLWAGRMIKLKNLEALKVLPQTVKLEIVSGLAHTEIQEKIRHCRAVALPSYSEVCPNFILEAISYGKPFIMTNETGLREVCDKGGIFVNPFNQKEIEDAFTKLMDQKVYEKHTQELLQFNLTRTWDELAKEYLSI